MDLRVRSRPRTRQLLSLRRLLRQRRQFVHAKGQLRSTMWSASQDSARYLQSPKQKRCSFPALSRLDADALRFHPRAQARHLKELGSMQKAAHEAKVRKERDLQAHQQRKESTLARALPVWESDILPSWRAVLREQRLRDLWWFGTMPQTARPRLWQNVIGNQLALAKSDYARAVQRLSKPDKEEAKQALQDSIRLASAHVFPDLRLFQENRPMHDDLVDLASAVCVHYSMAECVRPFRFADCCVANTDCCCSLVARGGHNRSSRISPPASPASGRFRGPSQCV